MSNAPSGNSKDSGLRKKEAEESEGAGICEQQPVRRCGAWRAEVDGRVGELTGRLAAVTGGRRIGQGKYGRKREEVAWDEIAAAVDEDLDRATAAIEQPSRWSHPWLNLSAWWSGSAITTAWESVHTAELALLSLERDDDVAVVAPRLLSWIERTMDKGPQRTAHETALREVTSELPKGGRLKVRAALTDVIEANGNRYANVRAFRNNLILITALLLALVVGVSIWHGVNHHFLSLCREAKRSQESLCLGGKGSKPDGVDVALVAAMGALGGLLAIAFTFAETEVAPTRYDPKTWQAFLKPVTGAAVAIIAVLFLQSGFLLAPSKEGQSTFLAYAVLFGFSQQLFTHFVDKQANSLITPDSKK